MSGEFGSYSSGYFYHQMETAAYDCLEGSAQITKLWGEFFEEFASVAKAISWSEAGDSGEYHPIMESMSKLPVLEAKLAQIRKYLKPFQNVAEEAIRNAQHKSTTN